MYLETKKITQVSYR